MNNRFLRPWQALRWVLVVSAITHMTLLAYFALVQRDITVLNYFNVLDFEYFFPGIQQGLLSQILSGAVYLGLFFGAYFFYGRGAKK